MTISLSIVLFARDRVGDLQDFHPVCGNAGAHGVFPSFRLLQVRRPRPLSPVSNLLRSACRSARDALPTSAESFSFASPLIRAPRRISSPSTRSITPLQRGAPRSCSAAVSSFGFVADEALEILDADQRAIYAGRRDLQVVFALAPDLRDRTRGPAPATAARNRRHAHLHRRSCRSAMICSRLRRLPDTAHAHHPVVRGFRSRRLDQRDHRALPMGSRRAEAASPR